MGEWQEVAISYRDATGHYCDCCGQPVPRRLYVATVAGQQHAFCGPACADLFQWYWLPRYGPPATRPSQDGAATPAT